ncbi:phosphoribosylaminoimidazolesuccinocarboxamide synthase [Amycolatopsis sp. NPDC023774]|uniref:phosphoribosylaminoimidazolesuccinocarboxamide synthase n=1 Tax=Amycolatopsis sp. NPDC023774 TaxID=3155015 RepID=UPI0033E82224
MTTLAEYPKIAAGKVRELYAVGDDHLLLVTSDRISAYDFVLDTPIPDKGRVLTAMSVFWFTQLADLIPNHLVAWDDPRIPAEVLGRALLVRRLDMLPVEAVARGYLTGSGFADYQRSGSVCGVELPGGLVESARLPEPIFTPATKAELGEHDENVSFETVAARIGVERATEVRDATLAIYRRGAEFAAERGILLADTKFEFGLDADGRLVLADEVLTPDSSRYWPADGYAPGHAQPSFDKQYVRDWLTGPSGWDRASNTQPPPLPDDVVAATRARYVEAYERISGLSLADWPGA